MTEFEAWAEKERSSPVVDYDKKYSDFKHAIKTNGSYEEHKKKSKTSPPQVN